MQKIELKKSSKVIVNCSHFIDKEDSSTVFRLSIVDYRKTWETYTTKDWKTKDKLEEFLRPLFVKKSLLSSDLQKLDDDKICQEFKGKSVYITTTIED